MIDGGEQALAHMYRHLQEQGVPVELTADHGLSKSLYFHDPEGHRLEIYCHTTQPVEAMQFMRQERADMAPYDSAAVPVA